jgi:4-diphosphocytidyl-2-C-methyl-D-erythritol kinase
LLRKIKYNGFAFAKVNLTLRILSKLKYGYHRIQSFIIFLNLKDQIQLKESDLMYDKIIFKGQFGKGINKKNNTISKLLQILRSKGFLKNVFFKIIIDKKIPQGSGLGGGSSDAASILNILKKKYYLKISKTKMTDIASQVGFDVPFCIDYFKKIINSSNKKFVRPRINFSFFLLLVYPNFKNSTRKIYKLNNLFSRPNSQLTEKYLKNNLINILKNDQNDLQTIVESKNKKIKDLIYYLSIQKNCLFSRMSGSGSTCYGVFQNLHSAKRAKKILKKYYPNYWSVVSKTR